jgi:Derlin-2/3
VRRFQVWRLFTSALFAGKFSFGFVMSMYFLSNFGGKVELSDRFVNAPNDFLTFVVFILLVISSIALFITGQALTLPSFTFALLYYWSRCEPEALLSLWGFQVKGYQFPFAMLLFTLLIGGDVWADVVGLAAGHMYFFLADVVPLEYGFHILKTPAFLNRRQERPQPPRLQTATAATAARQQASTGLFQGGGQRLGSN